MQTISSSNPDLYFLSRGGEMGELTRNKDWSTTSLGDPHKWPQSLRTTVAMVLSSKFPMFLWWGEEMIQFYNDAYRTSLGNDGKHPSALGQKAVECWPEIWDTIYPLIAQVRDYGLSTWSEDHLIPIHRNGKLEDVYWTFGYSPIIEQDGRTGGVLVICTETTEKVKNSLKLQESEASFRMMADNIPNLAWMAKADGWIYWYNKKWFEYTGTTPDQMEGWGWQSVHDPAQLPQVMERWQTSIASGQPFDMVFPIRGADGKFRQFLTRVLPVRDDEGKIYHWFGTNTDITKQIETELALKESEGRFRTMAESSEILIAVSDEIPKSIYFNKAWAKLTGRPIEQLLDQGWADLVHPDDKDAFIEKYIDAAKKYTHFSGEFRILNSHNEYRWVYASVPPLFKSDGRFAGFISSSIDITERKQSEQALQASEHRYRTLIEASNVATALFTGRELRIQYANEIMIGYWGKDNTIIGKTLSEALPELKGQPFLDQLDVVYTTGSSYEGVEEKAEITVQGRLQTYYFNFTFKALRDEGGRIYAIHQMATDVTQEVLAKKALENSEQNLRNTILQAPVAMCILRQPEYIVELANERMFELWGKSAAEVMGKQLFEGLPEIIGQGFDVILKGVYTSGKTYTAQAVETRLPRKGRIETVYVNFVYEAYYEADGIISGIIVVAIDVTEQVIARHKIEEVVAERTRELEDANDNLHKSNAELEQFAYIASHDLQEPLRKINTFSQMLENSLGNKMDEVSRKYLDKINNSTSRMNVLIRDVLTYSELVKGDEGFSKVDLNEIIENIKADYDLMIEQKGAVIEYKELPVIEAIPLQMSQLFGNIVGNALKFGRKDVKPLVTITASHLKARDFKNTLLDNSAGYYKITVTDNGIGFKAEYSEKIFNIFQRLHGKSEYEGTGIGLAMCKKIALNHGGDLNATGSSENGAVFNFFIPLKRKE